MPDQDRYDRIKARMTIDPVRLTEELVELPQYQSDAAEGAAEAQRVRDEAKDALDRLKAEVADAIRSDPNERKQPSEAQIASEVLLDDNVREALAVLRDTEYDLALWKALADGMRAKNSAIRAIADLIQAGYTSPNAVYAERRRNIDSERRRMREVQSG